MKIENNEINCVLEYIKTLWLKNPEISFGQFLEKINNKTNQSIFSLTNDEFINLCNNTKFITDNPINLINEMTFETYYGKDDIFMGYIIIHPFNNNIILNNKIDNIFNINGLWNEILEKIKDYDFYFKNKTLLFSKKKDVIDMLNWLKQYVLNIIDEE